MAIKGKTIIIQAPLLAKVLNQLFINHMGIERLLTCKSTEWINMIADIETDLEIDLHILISRQH